MEIQMVDSHKSYPSSEGIASFYRTTFSVLTATILDSYGSVETSDDFEEAKMQILWDDK